MNRILIGGENAGKIIDTCRDYVRMPVRHRLNYRLTDDVAVPNALEMPIEEYTERYFRTANKEWRILGLISMSDAEIFDELLANYRPYKGEIIE